jgi:hypothetical protein
METIKINYLHATSNTDDRQYRVSIVGISGQSVDAFPKTPVYKEPQRKILFQESLLPSAHLPPPHTAGLG